MTQRTDTGMSVIYGAKARMEMATKAAEHNAEVRAVYGHALSYSRQALLQVNSPPFSDSLFSHFEAYFQRLEMWGYVRYEGERNGR